LVRDFPSAGAVSIFIIIVDFIFNIACIEVLHPEVESNVTIFVTIAHCSIKVTEVNVITIPENRGARFHFK